MPSKSTKHITARVREGELELLRKRADLQGVTVSTYVRQLILQDVYGTDKYLQHCSARASHAAMVGVLELIKLLHKDGPQTQRFAHGLSSELNTHFGPEMGIPAYFSTTKRLQNDDFLNDIMVVYRKHNRNIK